MVAVYLLSLPFIHFLLILIIILMKAVTVSANSSLTQINSLLLTCPCNQITTIHQVITVITVIISITILIIVICSVT